jgi:hypothetical protein
VWGNGRSKKRGLAQRRSRNAALRFRIPGGSPSFARGDTRPNGERPLLRRAPGVASASGGRGQKQRVAHFTEFTNIVTMLASLVQVLV